MKQITFTTALKLISNQCSPITVISYSRSATTFHLQVNRSQLSSWAICLPPVSPPHPPSPRLLSSPCSTWFLCPVAPPEAAEMMNLWLRCICVSDIVMYLHWPQLPTPPPSIYPPRLIPNFPPFLPISLSCFSSIHPLIFIFSLSATWHRAASGVGDRTGSGHKTRHLRQRQTGTGLRDLPIDFHSGHFWNSPSDLSDKWWWKEATEAPRRCHVSRCQGFLGRNGGLCCQCWRCYTNTDVTGK